MALAFNYDDLILLVQAEQKQYGGAKTDLSLDERLRNLETAVFGGPRAGSESKRLKDVCRRIGILPPAPAAAEEPKKTELTAKAKNPKAHEVAGEVKTARKKPQRYEMPNEISRPVAAQPMQDSGSEPRPVDPAPVRQPEPIQQPEVSPSAQPEPTQPKQSEPAQTEPVATQTGGTEPGAATADSEAVIPGQSNNNDGLGGLIPIILLGGLVIFVFVVAGGALFLIVRERNRIASSQKPFEPISEEEQARAEASPLAEPRQDNLEPSLVSRQKSAPTEREITWSDAEQNASNSADRKEDVPAESVEEVAPPDGTVFAVKNRVFKISVSERSFQPIARQDLPPPSADEISSPNEPPPFAPYTTDPHAADALLFQPPARNSGTIQPHSVEASVAFVPVTASDEPAFQSGTPEFHEPLTEKSEFEPTPSPYEFAPPLPEGAIVPVSGLETKVDSAAISSYEQAQAKLDALLGRPPAPKQLTPENLFLQDSSAVAETVDGPFPQPLSAAPLVDDPPVTAASSAEPEGFSFSDLVRVAQGQDAQLEPESKEPEQQDEQHNLSDIAPTIETEWTIVGGALSDDDYQEFESDATDDESAVTANNASPLVSAGDSKLHSALQKLNRAYGVLPDLSANKESDLSPSGQVIDSPSPEQSSEVASDIDLPQTTDSVDAHEVEAALEELAPGLNAAALPKSFAATLAGVLGSAGVTRSRLSEDDVAGTGLTDAAPDASEALPSPTEVAFHDDSVFERLLRTLFADDDFHPELFPNLATGSEESGSPATAVTIPTATPLRSSSKSATTAAMNQARSDAGDVTPGPGLYGSAGGDPAAALVRSDSTQYQGQLRNLFSEVSKDDRLRRGEYQAVIYETQPGCLILVVDQSAAMKSPLNPGNSACKSDIVAVVINRFIHRLIKRCKSESGKIRASWYVGVVGYGDTVGPAFIGKHQGKELVNVADLSTTVDYVVPDRPKSTIVGIPVWVRPKAAGQARMCAGLGSALKLARDFVADNPTSHPPIIVNISGGAVSDGDPRPLANAIKEIQSADGNVLLFNVCLPGRPDDEMINFPDDPGQLPDHLAAKAMWDMSSPLLVKMIHLAREYQIDISPRARGFAWNSDVTAIAGLLEMCTADT
ncbi:MAG: hypothetical protein K2W95_21870 [Candidatus Obscuribacterales bacterium]|nr:hypothetical protein [Candidatus Obscuribacterales bacterium]